MKDIKKIEGIALFEHRFWLQVLGDHARLIFDALSPREKTLVQTAQGFIHIFDQLLAQARKPLTGPELMQLNQQAYQQTMQLRGFKLDLIRRHLVGEINIELPLTFLNHMVNELDDYLRILYYLMQGQGPTAHPVQYHLLWLLDAAGHADAIAGSLDLVEKRLREKSERFTKQFEEYYIKAAEFCGYLRTNLQRFPALSRFNLQVECEIKLFMAFLCELEEMVKANTLLSTLSPLLLDHMAREECYYLFKLSQVSEVTPPNCDPTKPRPE